MKITISNIDKEIGNKVKSITQINKTLAGDYLDMVLNHFEKESGASKFQGGLLEWRPLAPSTIKQRNRKGYTGKILTRTGLLQNSVQPYSSDSIFGVGTNRNYAITHELGTEIQRNPRTETFTRNRYSIGKKKGKFKKGTKSGQGFTYKAYRINIPKRSFLALSIQETKILMDKFIRLFMK